tara:strand:- start:632 stop:856 length:225 start_codon:yes stop_codon:yes gene_type:complete
MCSALLLLVSMITVKAITNTTCDVLVLGAGLAGTSAAWRLVGERPAGVPQPRDVARAARDVGGAAEARGAVADV